MNGIRLALVHYRMAAMYEMQYRVNLAVQILHTSLQAATGLIAIALVFQYTPDLGGWSRTDLLAIMGVHILVGGIIATFVRPAMQEMMNQIVEGEFDHVLVRPRDPQLMTAIRKISLWNLVDVFVGSGIVVWSVVESGLRIDLAAVAGFGVTLTCGVLIMYCVWLVLTSTSFRAIRVDDVVQLVDGLYQTGRWPVGVYPGWLRGVLTFVVPLAFAVTVPAQAVTGRLTLATAGLAITVTAASVAGSRWFFLRQMRSYSGASA